jgi:hypothetical protein
MPLVACWYRDPQPSLAWVSGPSGETVVATSLGAQPSLSVIQWLAPPRQMASHFLFGGPQLNQNLLKQSFVVHVGHSLLGLVMREINVAQGLQGEHCGFVKHD